ncbi:MAG: type I-D CRISPR-associated helicase Cas3', partial [Candidatus Methanomethyliaceae archaeon]
MNGQPVHLQVGEWAVPYEEGREALGRRLLPHQAFLAGAPAGAYVVHTPTGSGKTFAALLRYLERAKAEPGPFFGLMVYPTNALLEDQARQLKLAVETGGWRASMLPEEESQTDFGLLVTSGEMLGPSGGKGRQLETALDLLLRRYQRGLWLTNPDTLFYLFQLYYRHAGESLKYLSAFRYWVLDEFHLYEGGLLAEVVFLLDRVAGRAVQDLVVMTATPSAAADLVRRWWPDMQEVGLRSVNPANSARIIRHSMDLTVHPANGRFSLRNEAALRRLLTIIEATFEDTSLETLGGEATARTLVIVDSVAVANYLYRALCDRYGSSEVGAIHGFVPAGHRIMRPLTIGTRAVEVGVDFDTASLVMEGHDVPTALQRLGRAGRHRPAVVHW